MSSCCFSRSGRRGSSLAITRDWVIAIDCKDKSGTDSLWVREIKHEVIGFFAGVTGDLVGVLSLNATPPAVRNDGGREATSASFEARMRDSLAGRHAAVHVAPKREAAVAHRRPAQAAFALLQGCLAQGRIVGRHGKHSGELKATPAAPRTMSAPLESTRNTGQISSVVGARRGPPALQ